MVGRLLDSRFAFLAAAPIAIPLGVFAGLFPLYALAGFCVIAFLLIAITRVEWLLLALAAALPWEGALGYPSDAISVVKILGVLLFMAWLLRALLRTEPLRVSPALAWAGFFLFAVLLSTLFAPDPADSVLRRAALRCCSSSSSSSCCSSRTRSATCSGSCASSCCRARLAGAWGLYGFIALDLERAAGPISDPNDFAYLMVCALPLACYLLAEEKAPAGAVEHVLRAADRRDPRDAVARCAGRPRRARAVGDHHAPRAAQRRPARHRRDRERGGARVRAVGAAAPRPAVEQEPHRRQERQRARGAVDRGGADGRRPAAARASGRAASASSRPPTSATTRSRSARTRSSTTPTCTCWPRPACWAWWASSASSPRRGGCSRAGAEERSASGTGPASGWPRRCRRR